MTTQTAFIKVNIYITVSIYVLIPSMEEDLRTKYCDKDANQTSLEDVIWLFVIVRPQVLHSSVLTKENPDTWIMSYQYLDQD